MSSQTAPAAENTTSQVPEQILEMVQQGKQALEAGALEQALERFEAVVANFPERPEGYNNLGALYTSLSCFDKAEDCFGKVLELLPGNCNVHYNRGIVRIRLQKFDEAIADFNVVLATTPEDADCWNNLGVATFLKGDYATARGHFQQALQICPDFPNAVLNMCDTEVADGKAGAAIELCRQHLERFPEREIRRKMVQLMVDDGLTRLARARETAEAQLNEDPGDTETRKQLGRVIRACEALAEEPPAV